MSGHNANADCECVAAISALFAAAAWFASALHPVGMSGPGVYMPADSNHPLWAQMAARGRKILRGSRFNQIAAALTGVSALAQFFAWLLA